MYFCHCDHVTVLLHGATSFGSGKSCFRFSSNTFRILHEWSSTNYTSPQTFISNTSLPSRHTFNLFFRALWLGGCAVESTTTLCLSIEDKASEECRHRHFDWDTAQGDCAQEGRRWAVEYNHSVNSCFADFRFIVSAISLLQSPLRLHYFLKMYLYPRRRPQHESWVAPYTFFIFALTLVMSLIIVGIICLEVRMTLGLTGLVTYMFFFYVFWPYITDNADHDFTYVIFCPKYLQPFHTNQTLPVSSTPRSNLLT